MTLLSICVPTFNRADRITSFATELLKHPGDFELCIHIDGSTDETASKLAQICDGRLRISAAPNRGRASALLGALSLARSRFIMFSDDDDIITHKGLDIVLGDCATSLPAGCSGYIYQLADDRGRQLGSSFPVARSNLLALRADHHVTGDKKEVVLADVLRGAVTEPGTARRVPTSLYWARIALGSDVLCRNEIIGTKNYLAGGMTASIKVLKAENSAPLVQLGRVKLAAFTRRRYRSPVFAVRALLSMSWHVLRSRQW